MVKGALDHDSDGPVLQRMTDEEIEAWKKRQER